MDQLHREEGVILEAKKRVLGPEQGLAVLEKDPEPIPSSYVGQLTASEDSNFSSSRGTIPLLSGLCGHLLTYT